MSQVAAAQTLRYLATQYRSMQGLRLVPLSLLSFYEPLSRAGWFGWQPHDGSMAASVVELVVIGAAWLAWWLLGRYYRDHFGAVGGRPQRWGFWLAWIVYLALVPISRRLHVDLGSLWLAALCVREAGLSLGFRPHYLLVAGALSMSAFVPLLVPLHDPGLWTMSDVLGGTCLLVIGVGDHLALRRAIAAVTAIVQEPLPA
jgi:hypothetical protein